MLKHNLRSVGIINRAAAAIAVIGALAVTTRFVYLVSQIEAGWSTAAARWHTATFRRLTSASESVSLREPPEQADYWLAEVDRIVSGPGDEAQLAMGAACILDAPARGYLAAHLQPAFGLPGAPLIIGDTERAEAVFESRCHAKCLELAKRATDLQPANVNWWRMRALLTSALVVGGNTPDHSPRSSEWPKVLDEAARHDPGNALYDYLAAARLWQASSDYDSPPTAATATPPAKRGPFMLRIHDKQQFAAGVAHFERGQRKRFVAFGEAGLPAIAEFLKHSRLARGDQAEVATASLVVHGCGGLARDLFRWQMARAYVFDEQGDAARALALSMQCVHALAQMEAAGETAVYDLVFWVLRRALSQTGAFARASPDLASSAEQRKLMKQLRGAMLREKVLREAGKQFNQKTNPANAGDIAAWAVFSSTPASVSLLLIGGLLAWAVGKWLGPAADGPKSLRLWQHTIVWVTAYGVIFAVAGMAPAELIPAIVQPWIAIGSVAGGLLLVGVVLWRARFRFTLRAAFTMTFVCAVLCLPLAALYREGALDGLPMSLKILPRGIGAMDAATFQNMVRIAPHSWASAMTQWMLRSGYFFSAIACPVLVALWWGIRRAIAKPGQSPGGSRAWWAGLARDVGRSALALAAILLLVDLVLAPRMLAEAEANDQQRMLFFRDPAKSYAVSQEAIAAVERDRATMAALRQATDEEIEDLLGQGDAAPESTGR